MNAAARLVHQGVLTQHLVTAKWLKGIQWVVFWLSLGILISALSIIYVTHVNRVLNSIMQQNILEQNHLQIKHSQLLLERSSLMKQAQVQRMAENAFGMVVPNQQAIVVIKE